MLIYFLSSIAYYRGAMGILLVYDVTDESSFNSISSYPFLSSLLLSLGLSLSPTGTIFIISDIRNWIRNIEQHASDNVNKMLVGNKADMDESKRVSLWISSQALPLSLSLSIFSLTPQITLWFLSLSEISLYISLILV